MHILEGSGDPWRNKTDRVGRGLETYYKDKTLTIHHLCYFFSPSLRQHTSSVTNVKYKFILGRHVPVTTESVVIDHWIISKTGQICQRRTSIYRLSVNGPKISTTIQNITCEPLPTVVYSFVLVVQKISDNIFQFAKPLTPSTSFLDTCMDLRHHK